MEARTIYSRLREAQKKIGPITKSASNPHFKSRYTPLEDVLGAVLPALHAEGLVLTQLVRHHNGETTVDTVIWDEEGHSISGEYPISTDANPQKVASQITYARRYALVSMLGIATPDDDGNAAAGLGQPGSAEAALAALRRHP